MNLTAPERETVILFSDEDDTATVITHQRKIITKLEKNPLATETDDLSFDGTAGAEFELPAWAISFRRKKTKGHHGGVGNLPNATPNDAKPYVDVAETSAEVLLPAPYQGGEQ